MRQIPDEIAKPVLEWIEVKAPNPDGPPCVNAKVKLKAVSDHLLGDYRGGVDPTAGARTVSMDVKFYAVAGTEQSAIDQLLAGLRWAAGEEPLIAGLPGGGRLFLGESTVETEGDHDDPDHAGPIITLRARVSVPER